MLYNFEDKRQWPSAHHWFTTDRQPLPGGPSHIYKRKRKTFWNCMNKTISLNSEYIKIDGCIKIDSKPNIHFQMLK